MHWAMCWSADAVDTVLSTVNLPAKWAMMPLHKELSTDLKDTIIRHFQKGNSYSNVSSTFGVPQSRVLWHTGRPWEQLSMCPGRDGHVSCKAEPQQRWESSWRSTLLQNRRPSRMTWQQWGSGCQSLLSYKHWRTLGCRLIVHIRCHSSPESTWQNASSLPEHTLMMLMCSGKKCCGLMTQRSTQYHQGNLAQERGGIQAKKHCPHHEAWQRQYQAVGLLCELRNRLPCMHQGHDECHHAQGHIGWKPINVLSMLLIMTGEKHHWAPFFTSRITEILKSHR